MICWRFAADSAQFQTLTTTQPCSFEVLELSCRQLPRLRRGQDRNRHGNGLRVARGRRVAGGAGGGGGRGAEKDVQAGRGEGLARARKGQQREFCAGEAGQGASGVVYE